MGMYGWGAGRIMVWLALVAAFSLGAQEQAALETDDQLRLIERVLPPEAAAGVEFVLPTSAGDRIQIPGSGQWICRGDEPADERISISCYTRSVAPLLERQREMARRGIRGQAMRDQLDGEARSGELSLPDSGMEIYVSGELDQEGRIPDSLSVYYLLYVPFETRASIGVSDEQPDDPTVPYLHHAGTHEAHVMWMTTIEIRSGASDQRP